MKMRASLTLNMTVFHVTHRNHCLQTQNKESSIVVVRTLLISWRLTGNALSCVMWCMSGSPGRVKVLVRTVNPSAQYTALQRGAAAAFQITWLEQLFCCWDALLTPHLCFYSLHLVTMNKVMLLSLLNIVYSKAALYLGEFFNKDGIR